MKRQPRKMSEILKEMAQCLLWDPEGVPSAHAVQMALVIAHLAWNEAVGTGHARETYRSDWESIEADNPDLWKEFKSTDVQGMLDELLLFKQEHYPADQRRILTCGMVDDRLRVECLPPVAPGVDSGWEMCLCGLVRTGRREEAIGFVRETRRMSRNNAMLTVAQMAIKLGVGSVASRYSGRAWR